MTSSPDQNPQDNRQPIVVQQGGNGTAIGLIVAALIQAPAEALKEGVKGAAEALKPGS
jgi:hypothetical protein